MSGKVKFRRFLVGLSLLSFSLIPLLNPDNTAAWIDPSISFTDNTYGSAVGKYFAYGDGSSTTPYGISSPRHLYNLAWLQYLGVFNKETTVVTGEDGKTTTYYKTYYFELANDINMSGWTLPPIGTKDNPFVGRFNGKGYVISGLKVSDQLGDYNRHPYNLTFTSPNIVGFFGCIGAMNHVTYPYSINSSVNEATNFYLDNVQVFSHNSQSLVGLIAGYVNGKLNNAGVHYGKMSLKNGTSKLQDTYFDYVSRYSLIGDYNADEYNWSDKPGDVGYGGSLDIEDFVARTTNLSTSDGTTKLEAPGGVSKYEYLPFKGTGDLRKDDYTASNNTVTYIGQSATDKNIGYFTGNSVKASPIDVTKLSSNFYSVLNKDGTYENSSYIHTVNISEDDELYKQTKGKTYVKNTAYMIRLQGRMETFAETSTDRYTVIKDAKVGGKEYVQIIVPARSIWVKPSVAGTLRFVIVATDSSHKNFSLRKLTRVNAGDLSSGWQDTGTSALENDGVGRLPATSEIQRIDGNDSTKWTAQQAADIKAGKDFVFVYEKVVTKDDINNNVEYVLNNQDGGNGAYFWYLDLGQNGHSGGTTDGINNIDFVVQGEDSTIVKIGDKAYTKSNILFAVSGTSTSDVTYSFRRQADSALGVLYYINPASNGFTFAPIGSGNSNKATGDDCKTKASN